MDTAKTMNGVAPESESAINVHLERLTIGDLEVLEKFSRRDTTATELIDFLERIVDEDVRSLPLTDMGAIIEAVNESVLGMKNLGN
jgi:hypothetical protein